MDKPRKQPKPRSKASAFLKRVDRLERKIDRLRRKDEALESTRHEIRVGLNDLLSRLTRMNGSQRRAAENLPRPFNSIISDVKRLARWS